jgi:N-acetylneuraminate synthase
VNLTVPRGKTLVVIGRSSKAEEEVRLDYCRAHEIPVQRRASGGAAIVSGPGCLMYAVVLSYQLRPALRSLDEIKTAIRTIEDAGNRNIIILHCVAKYPPQDNEMNLNRMDTLRRLFPYPVGFSDHSIGYSMALAAVAKGACIIEKHFTLDKNMFGWDHKVSADAEELRIIVKESKRIQMALGDPQIKVVEDPERIRAFRRSIVAKRKINKGEIATEEMFDFKRPGDGLAPGAINVIIGKTAKRDIESDELIRVEDF